MVRHMQENLFLPQPSIIAAWIFGILLKVMLACIPLHSLCSFTYEYLGACLTCASKKMIVVVILPYLSPVALDVQNDNEIQFLAESNSLLKSRNPLTSILGPVN